jgi:multiple sugar transport system substrate-binding protein
MEAATAAWAAGHPDVAIEWDARPLAMFNDQPIADAVSGYDLVFVDHPTIGEAVRAGCLRALDGLLPASKLAELAGDSIAGSHQSYHYGSRQWALAVDAACQVAVVDPGAALTLPRTWPEVLDLARQAPGAVAIPLYPSDAIISLISISVSDSRATGRADTVVTEKAVEVLCELAELVDHRCYELNPPGMLNLMSRGTGDTPRYVPLLFGYTDYQRPSAPGHRLRFVDAPTFDGRPGGTVLGGAGLAVPAESRWPGRAAAFAAWVAGARAQRDVVCVRGGQPASRRVWADPTADALLGGFLSGTGATMRAAYVRPRDPWWPRFQQAAGQHLVVLLLQRAPAARIHADIVHLLDRYRQEALHP